MVPPIVPPGEGDTLATLSSTSGWANALLFPVSHSHKYLLHTAIVQSAGRQCGTASSPALNQQRGIQAGWLRGQASRRKDF